MSEEFDEIVDNLREPNSWIRLVFMIAFAVVLYLIIAPVILVIMVAQALFTLITGSPNTNLKEFSGALGQYIFQILKFLLYGTEDKPFPFADFPSTDDDDNDAGDTSTGSGKKNADKKSSTNPAKPAKKAAKKSAKKKASPKKTKTDNSANGADEEGES